MDWVPKGQRLDFESIHIYPLYHGVGSVSLHGHQHHEQVLQLDHDLQEGLRLLQALRANSPGQLIDDPRERER